MNTTGTKSYGVAVDLGTTHVRLSLWDLNKHVRLSGRYGLNAQQRFGSDVMTRLTAAVASPGLAHEIGQSARDSIRDALLDISTTEELPLTTVSRVVIVGNSAMLALCAEKNYDRLLKPAYWSRKIECQPEDTDSWRGSWGIAPSAAIEFVPPLAGFVGSDLLAGVLATGLVQLPAGELLIDFGTNSEIALWDGATLWATSAAGGPAFEGCGISCGMSAEPGAVFRVKPGQSGSGWHSEVIGGGTARGICGSGLVDIIALLRRDGHLNSAGRFRKLEAGQEISIIDGSNELTLKSQDVDAFQRAKAAIGAGIGILLKQAGMKFGDIRHIFVCGAFGRLLNLKNAQEIGLLPEIPTERIELWGDSALEGCEQLLFPTISDAAMERLRSISRLVNLALIPEFEEEFVRNLYLHPLA